MTTAPTQQMLQMILYLMCTKCLITFCQLLLEQILCLVSAYIALHLILYELCTLGLSACTMSFHAVKVFYF